MTASRWRARPARHGGWPRAVRHRSKVTWTTAPRSPGSSRGARCDALVNLASLGFGHAPAIVAAAAGAGLGRAVFVSTTAVTTALPARSKAVRLAAEDTIRTSGLAWTILRPTMIYGAPGDRNMSRLLALLARAGRAFPPGGPRSCFRCRAAAAGCSSPSTWRTWPAAVLAAVERPGTAGSCYDMAGPEPLTFAELLRASAAAVGCRVRLLPGAAGAGDRADPLLRAGEQPAEDPRGAVAAAGRGQGVPDRRRRPRPGVRAPAVRRGHPRGGRRPWPRDLARAAAPPGRSAATERPCQNRYCQDWSRTLVNTAGLGRLARTVIQLRPAQAGQRVRLRAQRMAPRPFGAARGPVAARGA